jgi:type IV pilus assembly protein PilF
MTKAMAAASRFTAGGLAAIALYSVLGGLVAGCATSNQQTASDLNLPSEQTDVRRRARIRLELAANYFEDGKTEIALDELQQVLAIDSTYPDAYNLRGLAYMRLGDMRAAEDNFRRAATLNPRDGDIQNNYGWLQCQQGRYAEAQQSFQQALASPIYGGRARTFLAMGVCQARSGQLEEAERNLVRSYELDAANPVTGYNLSNVLYQRGEFKRAQFYIRRINNSDLANAESLWLGIKVENRLNENQAMGQLSDTLRKRYPQSKERGSLDRRAFDE